MKVLIADKLSSKTEQALKALGATLEVKADLTADDLPAAIGDAQVLVVRSTKVTAATIAAGKKVVTDRAGRSGRQHDRRGGRQPARDLRHQLSRQEQRRGCRTGDRTAHRL